MGGVCLFPPKTFSLDVLHVAGAKQGSSGDFGELPSNDFRVFPEQGGCGKIRMGAACPCNYEFCAATGRDSSADSVLFPRQRIRWRQRPYY